MRQLPRRFPQAAEDPLSRRAARIAGPRTRSGDPVAEAAKGDIPTEDVKAAVPPDQLLIFTVDQGWEPLCKFLGVPVPVGPFPNVNDRAQIKKVIAGMTVGAYVVLAVGAVLLAGLIYGATRLFG